MSTIIKSDNKYTLGTLEHDNNKSTHEFKELNHENFKFSNTLPVSEQSVRDLFKSFFLRNSLVDHQLKSYENLMHKTIPQIIKENNEVIIISKNKKLKHRILISGPTICKPMAKENNGSINHITPIVAMTRKSTYHSTIMIDLTHEVYERIPKSTPCQITQNNFQNSLNTSNMLDVKMSQGTSENDPSDVKMYNKEKKSNLQTNLKDNSENEEIENSEIIEYDEIIKERRIYRQVPLFRMPTMVGSDICHTHNQLDFGACPYVFGGYFIINGNEKVIIPQETLRSNYPYITTDKSKKSLYKAEIRSCHESKMRSTSTLYISLSCTRNGTLPTIGVEVPFIKTSISLSQIFRMIGVDSQPDMRKYILAQHNSTKTHPYDHYIRNILKDDQNELSIDELKDYIGKKGIKEQTKEKRIKYIDNIFNNEFLPHVGLEKTNKTREKKAYYLGYVIMKILRVYNKEEEPDDRDNYANKRLSTCDTLSGLLFRQSLRFFLKSFTTSIHKAVENNKYVFVIDNMKHSKRITAVFKYVLSTGKWGMSKGGSSQNGVAQVLTRMTPLSTLAHLRRINSPINRDGKLTEPRQLHPSCWGLICSSESPEGPACGLVKNLALTSHVRVGYSSKYIIQLILPEITPLMEASCVEIQNGNWIIVNGKIIGLCDIHKTQSFVDYLRTMRRCFDIPYDTSITYKKKAREVQITLDSGCLSRPVFVLENIHKYQDIYKYYKDDLFSLWNRMMSEGVIEYIDKEEESTLRVAVLWQDFKNVKLSNEMEYTHIEIHPIVILGLCASIIPFANFDQAPRVTYGSVMLKQGLGLPSLNFRDRCDAAPIHGLLYPQKPAVSTFMEKILNLDKIPWSENVIVAIGCFTGYNQEDSIMFNEDSLQRGMLRSFMFKTIKEIAKNVGSDQESFEIPDAKQVSGLKLGNFSKLNPEDALMDIGEKIKLNDAIIGKIMNAELLGNSQEEEIQQVNNLMNWNNRKDEPTKKDRSVIYKSNETARVDRILKTIDQNGAPFVNLRYRCVRKPVIGDKFSSSCGQKGVISLTLPAHNMPFTQDGVVPDIIINPNCIPSRMTIGQLIEILLAKASVVKGQIGDGTPWHQMWDELTSEFGLKVAEEIKSMSVMKLLNKIGDELHSLGMERYGNERMYNGITGELMKGKFFMGPCRYMRLKHMVIDKVHARMNGPRQILTRQPVEGRSRNGGLRFGEMERDMVISYGAPYFLQDRLLNNSDYYETVVCEKCGMLAIPEPIKPKHYKQILGQESKPYCRVCETSNHVKTVIFPFAFKVMVQDMECFHVRMKFQLTKDG